MTDLRDLATPGRGLLQRAAGSVVSVRPTPRLWLLAVMISGDGPCCVVEMPGRISIYPTIAEAQRAQGRL